jgi:hypothetical protein
MNSDEIIICILSIIGGCYVLSCLYNKFNSNSASVKQSRKKRIKNITSVSPELINNDNETHH